MFSRVVKLAVAVTLWGFREIILGVTVFGRLEVGHGAASPDRRLLATIGGGERQLASYRGVIVGKGRPIGGAIACIRCGTWLEKDQSVYRSCSVA